MWFDSWEGVARVVLVGLAAYASLVLLLRVSGKRTLSKLNAFDLVVTVALGSTLATILLSKDVAFVEGVTAFAVLVFGQFVVARLSLRFSSVRRVVKAEPQVPLYRGQVLAGALRRERITAEEIRSVVRGAGLASVRQAAAVVLETDGSLHALTDLDGDLSALADVQGMDAVGRGPAP